MTQPFRARVVCSRTCQFLALAAIVVFCAFSLSAADIPATMPLDQVKPGMVGEAHTIFAGDAIEKFNFVVLGVLPNLIGPRQSIILVQLNGANVEHSGVVAGMSGSPAYIDGKLVGALSLKFGVFNKEPLAGVTPIADMLALPTEDAPATLRAGAPAGSVEAGLSSANTEVAAASVRYPLPSNWTQLAGMPRNGYLEPIASPLVLSGFSPASIRQYAGEWLPYGMVAAPGGAVGPQPDDAKIVAGDMVSVVLLQGDLSVSAACTVTLITDDRVYICGHPVFDSGNTRMPMARGRVVTTLASEYESTKIVNTGGVIGTITQDRVTAVMGKMGAKPPMIPVELSMVTPAGEKQFHVEMVSDPRLTPALIGMVAFNSLTQNTAYSEGTTLQLTGTIDIAGHSPVALQSMYAPTDQFIPGGTLVAANVQSTFTRIFSNPYETPVINGVKLRVESSPDRRVARIQDAWASVSEAVPGQALSVKVLLQPYRGAPEIREVPITIPVQATRGTTLRVQVSDSDSLNRMGTLVAAQGRLGSLDQLISLLNRERRNNQLYVTLLKPTPTLWMADKEMPNAPLSEINILNQRPLPGNTVLLRESAAGEWSVPMDEIIAGSASVFVEIK